MMTLRTALAAALLVPATALAFTSPVAAQEAEASSPAPAEELTEARAIIDAIYPPAERDTIFRQMVGDIAGQFGTGAMQDPIFQEPGIRAIMDSFLESLPDRLMPTIEKHLPQIIDATVIAYANEFSLEELRQIRAFSQTPAGSRYFRQSRTLLGDPAVAAANQRYFAEISKLQQEASQDIRNEVEQYLAENPEALERIKSSMEPGS